MSLLTTVFSQGTHAARPAATANNNGYYYYETDTAQLFQSWNLAWVALTTSPALQLWRATAPVSDATFSSASTFASTGYPANNTFSKLSAASILLYRIEGDFTTGTAGTSPAFIEMALYVDGVFYENVITHYSATAQIMTIGMVVTTRSLLSAGSHTFDIRCRSGNGTSCTARVSTSFDMDVIEIVPGVITS